MSIYRVIAEIYNKPQAVDPGYMQTMAGVFARRQRGDQASPEEWDRMVAARDTTAARRAASSRAGGGSIAVIPVYGLLTQRAGLVSDYSGGTSYQALSSQLREAVADDSVGQILLDIDSPGGAVAGCQEFVSEIYQLRTQKPIIGVANAQAASAAYWIGSACTELYCTPSGEAGSIGVWTGHEDMSEALNQAGVKITLVSAGRFKTEGNQYGPLDPAAKDFMQKRVDESYRAFTTSVARGRNVPLASVRSGMGQGRMLGADDALAQKMIDGIAPMSSLISDMQRSPRSAGGGSGFGAVAAKAAFRRREIEMLGDKPSKSPAEIAAAARRREIDLLELGGAPRTTRHSR